MTQVRTTAGLRAEVPWDLYDEIVKYAASHDRSISSVVRLAVRQFLEREIDK